MEYTDLLREPLGFLLALSFAAATVIGGMIATALLKAARVYLEQHNLGIAEEFIAAGIDYAEAKLQAIPGPKRMEWLLEQAEARGLDVDEIQAEAIFQAIQRARKSAADAAAAAAAQPAAPTYYASYPVAEPVYPYQTPGVTVTLGQTGVSNASPLVAEGEVSANA